MLSVAVIAAAVVPWHDFQGHTHWGKVTWLPFVSGPLRLRDVVANVLLFVPLGAAVARGSSTHHMIRNATLVGAGVSLVGEWAQVYSHSRFPSATDLVNNMCGAVLAASTVRAWRRRWE